MKKEKVENAPSKEGMILDVMKTYKKLQRGNNNAAKNDIWNPTVRCLALMISPQPFLPIMSKALVFKIYTKPLKMMVDVRANSLVFTIRFKPIFSKCFCLGVILADFAVVFEPGARRVCCGAVSRSLQAFSRRFPGEWAKPGGQAAALWYALVNRPSRTAARTMAT